MPLHVSSTCVHRQGVKIVLYDLWYHHTYRWPSGAHDERGLRRWVHSYVFMWKYGSLSVFFWVFPRRLIVVCLRFGTLYQFHLHGLGMKYEVYFILHIQPLKLEQIECSETSVNHNKTPGKHPKEYRQDPKHGESLKSRIWKVFSDTRVPSQPVHGTATYRCDDTRGCIVQLWPPDDKHVCSKHVEE